MTERINRHNATLILLTVLALTLGALLFRCHRRTLLLQRDLNTAVSRGVLVEAHLMMCRQNKGCVE